MLSRREALKKASIIAGGVLLPEFLSAQSVTRLVRMSSDAVNDFGPDFIWGAATAAYQIEGAWNKDGKGPSIWDTFSHTKGKIDGGHTGDVACDFYHRYASDLDLLRSLNMSSFRFSLAWSRILPNGTGKANSKGIDFYNRLIDSCLEKGITPWVTLYHWDLPQALEDKGGWMNRDVCGWFEEYSALCAKAFGDRVRHWMILNEPLAFTMLGYGLKIHAPGRFGFRKFLRAAHHAALCQAIGGRTLRSVNESFDIGSTFSTAPVEPVKAKKRHQKSAELFDAMLNRMFLEPAMGMGYPTDAFPTLKRIEKYMEQGDEQNMAFDFDFHGLQNYTRFVAARRFYIPWVRAIEKTAEKRNIEEEFITQMGWEVYPEGIYRSLKQFAAYDKIDRIIVTENGAAFEDHPLNGAIHDTQRTSFYREYISEVHRAKSDGVNVQGYFAWSLLDNFEWREGYTPRFGLVYVDFETQNRLIKDSGKWLGNYIGH